MTRMDVVEVPEGAADAGRAKGGKTREDRRIGELDCTVPVRHTAGPHRWTVEQVHHHQKTLPSRRTALPNSDHSSAPPLLPVRTPDRRTDPSSPRPWLSDRTPSRPARLTPHCRVPRRESTVTDEDVEKRRVAG